MLPHIQRGIWILVIMIVIVLLLSLASALAEGTSTPSEECNAGGVPKWIGNGLCNDENNHEACDWDGGDCCGDVDTALCIHCKW